MEGALWLACVIALVTWAKGAEGAWELPIVHLNDFHARFEPATMWGGACPDDAGPDECVGGIARVVGLAKRLKAQMPNALLLNAGDNFQGTLWYAVYRWNVTAHFLNMLPWDAVTLGNHEFDHKMEGVVPFLKALDAPVVVCNIDDSAEPSIQGLYKKSVVVERDGKKIGIIGVITSETKDISSPEGLEFGLEEEAVAAEAAALTAAGVEVVIVLSHAGIEEDIRMAESVPHIDVIVGGHSHTLLYTGTPPRNDSAFKEYPYIVQQTSGRKVAIVQASAYSKYLGNLSAVFDDNGELMAATGNPVLLDSSVEPDADVEAELVPWRESLSALSETVVGRTQVLLEHAAGVCRAGECNLGSLVADAYVDAWLGNASAGEWTAAPIGITNSGGLRAPIEETNDGEITFDDLVTTLPFQNTVDLLELQGADLQSVLEQSVSVALRRRGPRRESRWADVSFQGFLQISGLHVTFDLSKPEGSRVVRAEALCHRCRVPVFEPLDPQRWYPIALNSFLARGGDGYSQFRDKSRNHEQGRVDLDVMRLFFKTRGPVAQPRDGRIVVQNAGDFFKSQGAVSN